MRPKHLGGVLLFLLFISSSCWAFADSGSCTYFYDDFSGISANAWSAAYGNWYFQNEKLNVEQIDSGKMAHAEAAFYPYDLFTVDVDIETVSLPQGGAYGIYPFTTGDVLFGADGKTLEGVGAIIYASGNAYLIGWDVIGNTWYQSTKYPATGPVTSIGVAYSSDAVTLRINRQNTSMKFSGNFAYTFWSIDKLWLTAQGDGTHVRFDNVCAGPLTTPPPPLLEAPQNLRYTLNGNMLTLNWDAASGASGYKIGVGQQSGIYTRTLTRGNTTQFGPINVVNQPAGTYHLAVKAYNGSQESLYSNDITIVYNPAVSGLQAPQNLRYTLNGTKLTIKWDSVAGADGYKIGLGTTGPGNYAPVFDLGGITQLGPRDVSGYPPGTYYLAVKAYDSYHDSEYSNEISVAATGSDILNNAFSQIDSPEVRDRMWNVGDGVTIRWNESLTAFIEAGALISVGPAATPFIISKFAGEPSWVRDDALLMYARVLAETMDKSAVQPLADFLDVNLTGDVLWSVDAATHTLKILTDQQDLSDIVSYEPEKVLDTVARARAWLLSAVSESGKSSQQKSPYSCQKNWNIVDAKGNVISTIPTKSFTKPDRPVNDFAIRDIYDKGGKIYDANGKPIDNVDDAVKQAKFSIDSNCASRDLQQTFNTPIPNMGPANPEDARRALIKAGFQENKPPTEAEVNAMTDAQKQALIGKSVVYHDTSGNASHFARIIAVVNGKIITEQKNQDSPIFQMDLNAKDFYQGIGANDPKILSTPPGVKLELKPAAPSCTPRPIKSFNDMMDNYVYALDSCPYYLCSAGPACTDYTYSEWSDCQSDGTQTRDVTGKIPDGCAGDPPDPPQLTQSCTQSCVSYSCSAWSDCRQGEQGQQGTQICTGTVTGIPTGCVGTPPDPYTQPCTYVPPECTDYTYSDSVCRADQPWDGLVGLGTITRTYAGVPSGCVGGITIPSPTTRCCDGIDPC